MDETYEQTLPALPPEFVQMISCQVALYASLAPSSAFNREEFETDPLAWVDRNRGF